MEIIGEIPTLVDVKYSELDNTVKYIFLSKGQIIEFSYIEKGDGKDIICAPSQTGCNLKCTFCFLSDYELTTRNLTPDEITLPIAYILGDLGLLEEDNPNKILLISYMGCGEPLLNIANVIESSKELRRAYKEHYTVVRFAVASLIPSTTLMLRFIAAVKGSQLMVKFHFSLHSPDQGVRKEIMPGASGIAQSIPLVEYFMHYTDNSAEIHYTLIDEVNDRDEDIEALEKLLGSRGISVKFLEYNEKPSIVLRRSARIRVFREALDRAGIETEYYLPPGSDIGSSCGQFLMEYYERYNKV